MRDASTYIAYAVVLHKKKKKKGQLFFSKTKTATTAKNDVSGV